MTVISIVAVRAVQRARVPLSAAPPAAEMPAALDSPHLGKGRPGPADGTETFHPASGKRRRPPTVARKEKGYGEKARHGLKRLRVGAGSGRELVDVAAVLAQGSLE